MHKIPRRFIIASVLYFATGITSGVIGSTIQGPEHFRTVHAHINLLGFVAMMIYGLVYLTIPHFSGKKIKSEYLANVQFWLANVGLVGFTILNAVYAFYMVTPIRIAIGPFAAMEALSGYLFAYNVIATLKQKPLLKAIGKKHAA